MSDKKLTPLGKERLKEAEMKISALAKQSGVSQKTRVFIGNIGSPAAVGKSTLMMPPHYLVQPEDLPAELHLARLDLKEITEEEWVVLFDDWVKQKIMIKEKKSSKPKSQFEIDTTIEYGKAFLRLYRDQKCFDKTFHAVVGHELGHCFRKHTLKSTLASFGMDLLALPTLGLSSLLKNKILQPFYKKHETEADLFSYKNFGSAGLISFFQEFSESGKVLHAKYPKKYDARGGNKADHDHPHLQQRISFLRALDLNKAGR